LARAEETPDLAGRAIGFQLAHASRVLHNMLPDIHEAQARSLEGGGRPSLDFLSDIGWKRYQTVMDMVTRLVREEARGRNNDSPL
jgi:hypothetical protein